MWSSPDVVGLFSNNVVSFSSNVVLSDPLFSLNSVWKPRMLSVRADYVLSSLQLSMLRRHLEELGHGYKLSEIKEALDILADTRIAVEEQTIEAKTGRQRRTRDFSSILTHYTASTIEGDHNGEETYIAMTFHPAATAAILQLAFYPINQLRVGKLKRPLARWLTTRMSHNYRQARKNSYVQNDGYHISLKTILDERGLPREVRLRANVEAVRAALGEMKQRRILSEMRPFDEKMIHAPSKRRPKIVDAIW